MNLIVTQRAFVHGIAGVRLGIVAASASQVREAIGMTTP